MYYDLLLKRGLFVIMFRFNWVVYFDCFFGYFINGLVLRFENFDIGS